MWVLCALAPSNQRPLARWPLAFLKLAERQQIVDHLCPFASIGDGKGSFLPNRHLRITGHDGEPHTWRDCHPWCFERHDTASAAVDVARCWEWQGRWLLVLLVVVLQVVGVVNVFFVLMPLPSLWCALITVIVDGKCCCHVILLGCTHPVTSFPPSESLQ